jgi:hypothetical protein
MTTSLTRRRFALVALALFAPAGCRTLLQSPDEPVAMPDITPTRLDYIDTDGFDAVLENALVNQDPVVVVRTGRTKPDWDCRLNAWIAAWNRGSSRPITVRGQVALAAAALDKDAVRQLRLLVNGLLDRAEEVAQAGSTWWIDHRERSRRIALLKPYSLRFHMDDESSIQLVFFHGNYAPYYPRFVQTLTESAGMESGEWTRAVDCSHCSRRKAREVEGTLTSK